jgi:hypothetical protein
LLGAVVGAQRPCLFRGTGSAVGKRALGFEVIALPIRLDHRDAIHVLGAIHTFACPLWLGEVPMQHFHLDDLLSLEAAAATGPARSLAAPPRGARLRLIPGGAAPHGRD